MATHLTFADYYSPLELSDDASYRKFWTAVLQFATADGADSVWYRLDAGTDCLAVEIDGELYPMEPPPEEYRAELFHALMHLAGPGWIGRVKSLMNRSGYVGSISLQALTGDVLWHAQRVHHGVRLTRVPQHNLRP